MSAATADCAVATGSCVRRGSGSARGRCPPRGCARSRRPRAAEADAVDLRRGQPLDLEAARLRAPALRRGIGRDRPGGLGPGAGPLGQRRRGRARLLGEQPDRTLLGGERRRREQSASGQAAGPAPRRSDPTRLRRGLARGSGRGAIADTRRQRGNWSSGRTRSTRDVGGGISQVTRNTVPPRTRTMSRTRRMRLMVDMIPSDAPRRRRGERLASRPDGRFISTACARFQRSVKRPGG